MHSDPVRQERPISILGIDVPQELIRRWRGWFAPEAQPFPTSGFPASCGPVPMGRDVEAPLEVRDTFFMYGGS